MTKQDRALVKGAIRRCFSRCELRRQVVEAALISGYSDPTRPRVKAWGRCQECKKPTPKSYLQVDHRFEPVLPLDKTLDDVVMLQGGWDLLIDRMWCDKMNLQAICEECHVVKTQAENKIRRKNKKDKKHGKSI